MDDTKSMILYLQGISSTDRLEIESRIGSENVKTAPEVEVGDAHGEAALGELMIYLTPAVLIGFMSWLDSRPTITRIRHVEIKADGTTKIVEKIAETRRTTNPAKALVEYIKRSFPGSDLSQQ